MRCALRQRFPEDGLSAHLSPQAPTDLLTGTFGTCAIAGIYGIPIVYAADNWPDSAQEFLTDAQLARLEPPDLKCNPQFQELMEQLEWIAREEGPIEGFINWQGVLNNAHRIRGAQLFTDLIEEPRRCQHLFACVFQTMAEAIHLVHQRQRSTGVDYRFVTVSNCLVNLVSPSIYREFLLPWDQELAALYGCIGVHNCAWTVDPFLQDYAKISGVAYLDMGLKSDLVRARAMFPGARRAVMYSPVRLADQTEDLIASDLRRIAMELGPCDLVVADIEAGTSDEKVRFVVDVCRRISESCHPSSGSRPSCGLGLNPS